MKNNHLKLLLATVGVAAIGFSALAWTGNQKSNSIRSAQDTVPKPKSTPSTQNKKDFDKELNDLDKAMKELRNVPEIDLNKMQQDIKASMKKLDEELSNQKIDMEKMQKELHESLSKINTEKIQEELKASLKEIDKLDVQKLQKEIKESISKIDADKMKEELSASLKELDKIDLEKMKKELQQSMEEVRAKVNADEISKKVQEALEKVNVDKIKVDMDKVSDELERNKHHMKLDLEKAQKELEKTKKELKGYQEMVYEMENEGLLKTTGDYKIEYKDSELFINGEKQPTQVTNKYKKYFPKDGVIIRKEKGEMNINIQ